jgi:hypothetical protein
MHVRLKLLYACAQWHSSRKFTLLPVDTVNCVTTLKAGIVGAGGGSEGSSNTVRAGIGNGDLSIRGGTYWDNIVIVEMFWCVVCASCWMMGSGTVLVFG